MRRIFDEDPAGRYNRGFFSNKGLYSRNVRIGLSFPVKVSLEQGKFYCQDGHKRLSAIASMEKLEVYKKRRKINIIVINNGNSRSNDCWRGRNMH